MSRFSNIKTPNVLRLRHSPAILLGFSFCICGVLTPTPVAQAQTPPPGGAAASPEVLPPGAITAQMRTDDPRLNAPVSFRSPRVTVRELMGALGTMANVPLRIREGVRAPREIDTRFASGDAIVCAFLPETPLADALNALGGLLGYDKARWTWERVKNADGGFAYELTPPSTRLSAYALKVRADIQADFEAQASRSIAALDSAPTKPRGDATSPIPYDDEQTDRKNVCLEVFRQALTPEERLAVLRGGVRVVTAEPSSPLWATIKQAGGEQATSVYRSFFVTNEAINSRKPPPIAPGSIGVAFRSRSFALYGLCPVLAINVMSAPNPLVACDESAWIERLNRSWADTARRDRRSIVAPEAEQRTIKSVAAPLPAPEPKSAASKTPDEVVDVEELALWRLSQGASLPILALPPPRHESRLERSEQGNPMVYGIVTTPPREVTLYVTRKDENGQEKRVPIVDKDGGTMTTSGSGFAEDHPLRKTLEGKTVASVLNGLEQWPTNLRRKWSGSRENPILLLRDPVAPFRSDGGKWTLPQRP